MLRSGWISGVEKRSVFCWLFDNETDTILHINNGEKWINIKNRLELEEILRNSSLVEEIFESSANYLLIKLKNISASKFQELLKPYKIMVRDCSNFDFLDDRFVRIAVKSSSANERLKKALEEIC